jgi:hypothetical protein
MERPAPLFHYAQIGTRWRATARSALGPLSAHGESRHEARTALEQILAIARAIEVTRKHGPISVSLTDLSARHSK